MSNIKTGDILNFDYTGAVQSMTLPKGTYKLECWGAQGGGLQNDSSLDTAQGGLGGYSVGILTLSSQTTIYIYVGGKGKSIGSGLAEGGFNGGGSAYGSGTGEPGNGGGGATDIRISTDSLYSRVIVAGGGGGAGEDSGDRPGFGGGVTGGISSGHGTSATQTSTGTGGVFGRGANTAYDGGAGGGGWYGGGTNGGSQTTPTSNDGNDTSGGCGGSGYVYTGSTASNYPSGCLLNSSYHLTEAQTIAGDTSFPSPSGTSETGHSGNGYCRITVIECKNVALYTRINNSMKKATAFYFKLNNNKMYGVGSANFNGTVMNFDYTGSVQTATLAPGTYKLECWGAEGGSSTYHNATGGKGGYASGIYTITENKTLYVYVGGKGNTGSYAVYGGWNGGGGVTNSYNSGGSGNHLGTGGGATDISLVGGDCALDGYYRYVRTESSYNSRLIVAGGGGGAEYSNGTAGGGTKGINTDTTREYAGTQTAAGTFYGNGTSSYVTMYAGGFGYGVSTTGGHTNHAMGACGGGGYYGGGAYGNNGNYSHGFGGSGHVSYALSDTTLLDGEKDFSSPTGSSETGHSGNGYVRITKLTDVIYLTHANNDIMDFNYTGSTQSKTLKPGTYTIESWGGQGGTCSSCIGGYGGYSKGTITLTKATTVYISVGGAGSSSSTTAGFNGGGTGISSGRGGGGATDVRIGQNSLYSRVIVAGGGGGAGVTGANANPCGCGGGEYGGDGYYNNTTGSYPTGQNRCGGSASQTAGGITWSTGTQATFGQGGNASGYSCGGGGGGWYGGGGAYDNDSDSDGRWGGGGSGYVYTSTTAKNYPSGCLLNSTHYLTNAQTIAGNTSFTSPTGSTETGHTGNGFCRITNLNPTQYGLYIKTNSGWNYINL